MRPKHPWLARLSIGLTMLILAFIGVVVTDLYETGGWEFWKWTIPLYALMGLWLSWYVRRSIETIYPVTLWHELLHWIGLFGSIILVSSFVEMGILSRALAGLFALTLLSLNIFTLGIYAESTFLLIGFVLGLFAFFVGVAVEYLYAFTIPLLLISIGTLGFLIWHSHKKITIPKP